MGAANIGSTFTLPLTLAFPSGPGTLRYPLRNSCLESLPDVKGHEYST